MRNAVLGALALGSTIALGGCPSPAGDDDTTSADASDSDAGSDTSADESDASTDAETESETDTGEPEVVDYLSDGPHPVGNQSFVLGDPDGERELTVEVWYPAVESARAAAEAGQSILAFEPDGPDGQSFADLVAAGPEACVRKQTASAAAPEPIAGSLPTVVFSHCHGCARFSSFTLAERLASHGFVVAAVDHEGSTIFDQDALPPLDTETLELRAADVVRVIDELLDPAAVDLPEALVARADPERLGVFGHSFGAVTTGKVLQDDDRPKAGVAMAAPLENPVLPGVVMAEIDEPLMLFVAVEDNSITEFGNMAIRTNFTMATTPVWKLEFADTGHFGPSDLAGLSEYFAAGCGDGVRQTDGEPFTYLDPFVVRELAAGRIAAFFGLYLLDDADARAQLEAPDAALDIDVRE